VSRTLSSSARLDADEAFALGQDSFYGSRRRRRNFAKAFPLLMVAARAGIPHAQNLVGYCLDEGKGVKRDRAAARRWYAKAARAGHTVATVNLAMSYEFGTGGRRSPKRAAALYRTAAQVGDAWAQCNLGVLYLDGDGVEEDWSAGVRWLKAAASQGEPKAQYNLGRAYLELGGNDNRKRALRWLATATRNGHAEAARLFKRVCRDPKATHRRSA
jgi:hypothetical protein